MKILFVNKFLYPNGGSETYIFKLAQQLERLGHEVQFFGMEHPDRIVGNKLQLFTSNMDFRGNTDGIGSKLGKIIYPFKIIYSREAAAKILRLLDDMQPEVVHLNNINFQITPSIIPAIRKWERINKKRIRIVYTAHDYQWVCPNHMLYDIKHSEICERCVKGSCINCITYRCIHGSLIKSILGAIEGWIYRHNKAYSMVDTVIAPSGFMQSVLSSRRDIRDNIVMIHNFIDRDSNSVIDDNTKENTNYILYFGRLDREKGVNLLIEAATRLPNILFKVAGSGPLREALDGYSNIECLGFVSGDSLATLISEASFTIYPSQWYENCPFSIMESLSLGTPVLGSNLGGISELIDNGINGELFRYDSIDDLCKHILDMWTNTDKLRKYRENCKNLKFHSLNTYADNLLNIYNGQAINSK